MALEKMRTYYTPDEELALPDENQRFEQEWSDPRTLAALGEGEGGLSALEATAGAFAKRKMDVPYALRKAIQEKTPIDPRATMAAIESGVLPPADKLPPFTPFPVSKTVTFPRTLEQAVNKQGLVGDLKPPVDMPETVPSLTMPSGVPAKTSDLAALQKLMSTGSLASPIPVASAPVKADVPGALKGAIPATTPTQPAPPADGSGGDEMSSLRKQLGIQQMFEALGSAGSGKNLYTDGGILGDRMKQIEALRAKKAEKEVTDAQEVANNKAQVDYLISRFPEQTDSLTKLYGMTRKANFPQFVRLEEQIALDRAKKQDIGAKAEDRAKTQEYRAGTLDLKRDIAKDNRDYRAVQAGLKQSELNLRSAENERKATGSAEPTEKERSAFQTSMKPAEKTAVALRDADTLNSLGEGMLVTGQPPAFLSRADIAAFNGVPFGQASRSQLAQSNPQAYDLLTKMAEIKTIIGHEYFGSALSPSEAERQRQFMDFSALDSPESLAKKMKNYHDTLANKATVFLRPRVVNSPLGAEWAQSTGLDALSGEGGTFAGLLDAPKAAAPKAAEVKEPAAVEGKVRMLSPDNRVAKIPAAEVEARKAQGWKEAP
jgi:hypothetical protein